MASGSLGHFRVSSMVRRFPHFVRYPAVDCAPVRVGFYIILFILSVRITMRTKRSQWTFSAMVRTPTIRLESSA
ncbi:hypothetical protein FA13DRAFT_1741416 [Coprinellus micaceus]|uniref:Uncharacterized protein n=1 Tax=Coprinellus micaceus TaxID=71717 RepID=A0A4Y7SJP5_COPMI|nr:hypothetical protein FA13DRAFT_1741416 [Coprinellus micaceus]